LPRSSGMSLRSCRIAPLIIDRTASELLIAVSAQRLLLALVEPQVVQVFVR